MGLFASGRRVGGERDALNWFMADETTRQWEEDCKEEEKIAKGKMEDKSLQVEGVQKAPELPVSQVSTKERGPTRRRTKVKWQAGPQKR